MSDRRVDRGSQKVPAPLASRPAVGLRARTAAQPLSVEERTNARTVALTESDAASLSAAIAALPDPAEIPGEIVILPAAIASPRSLAKSVLAVFGRTKTVSRARRCSALLARGYVEIGAAEDDADLAWGRAPGRPSANSAT